ncbi:hypothetical protein [Silvibacterium dinghuense]|uniref:Uncharacterized protein n=1 Tax=Silvibacterium dinghuense TaxID=1560006 RepID=A0A4Q1SCT1_9BACT|nr:hypothetical protein [Silvibacterium dinghuense]RXS95022.1 hypothetical protein ESZ00_10360 [Silvibacterium dinghuense]GGH09943.1 hypothetical protein GCM10011586_28070 [Silvibacterium dinghuense]
MALTGKKLPFAVLSTAVLCGVAFVGSVYYLRAQGLPCSHLTPLTVLATMAAFLMSICFRQMARYKERPQRWILAACLAVAALALVLDFRYVRHYRDACDGLGQGVPLLK